MNVCGFICNGYDFYVLVFILVVALDLCCLVMISICLSRFLRLGLDVYGLVWVCTCYAVKENIYSTKYFKFCRVSAIKCQRLGIAIEHHYLTKKWSIFSLQKYF